MPTTASTCTSTPSACTTPSRCGGGSRREPYTLPPSDVLLAKLLRTRMTLADVRDVAALLRDVDIREDEDRRALGLRYLARVVARDWGLYHDVTGNLRRVAAQAGALGLGAGEAERVGTAAARVSRRWTPSTRARAGGCGR